MHLKTISKQYAYCQTRKHCKHTTTLFPFFICSETVQNSKNCLKQNQSQRSGYAQSQHFTQRVKFSTSSDDGLPSERESHPMVVFSSDSSPTGTTLSKHEFNIKNCCTPEDLLELVDHQMKYDSFHNDQITLVAQQYQQIVFANLPISHLSDNFHFRRKQIESTASALEKIKDLTSDSRWEHFLSSAKSALAKDIIPLTNQATLLNCLGSLLIPEESEIMSTLLNNCLGSIKVLTLKDIALLSDVCCQFDFEHHFVRKRIVLSAIHDKMMHCDVTEINLADLCCSLNNVGPVVGDDSLRLLADILKRRLTLDSTSVTPGVFLMVHQLLTSHGLPYFQDLDLASVNKLYNNQMSLTDLPSMNPNLLFYSSPISNLLDKVADFCRTEVESTESSSKFSFTTLSYCLQSLNEEKLHSVIAEADAFLLIELINHHTAIGLTNRATILAYYNQALNLMPELTKAFENDQFNKVHKVLNNFLRLMHHSNIQPDKDFQRIILSEVYFDINRVNIDTPKPVLEFYFELAIDMLKQNNMLSFTDLSTLTCALSRLDTGSMVKLYQNLNQIFEETQPDMKVKNQIQKLKASLQELFRDKLTRAVDLPTSLIKTVLTTRLCGSNVSQPGLFEHVLADLPRFVFSGVRRERNLLGALAVLGFTSRLCPLYHEELLEELTGFVARECPNSPTPALQLLRALASAGYVPQDFDLLTSWLWTLISQLLKTEAVDKSFMVEIAFNMSVLGLFHDELLGTIFSLSFLSELHSELRVKPDPVTVDTHQQLVWLSRSVAIECPHLPVPYLNQSNESSRKISRVDFLYQQKLLTSLWRLCPEDEPGVRLVAPSQSPYGHQIDAELILNLNAPFTPSSNESLETVCQRVAILFVNHLDVCLGAKQELRGLTQAVIRQLQILGYVVVTLSQNEFSSMEICNEQAQDDLVREKINSALGFQVFAP